jgi:flagellar motility protein MotE (MotC chaperone)
MGALREEMRRAPKEQDREVLKREREALEATASALAKASEALKRDTGKLESLLEKVSHSKGALKADQQSRATEAAGAVAAIPPGKLPLDLLAKQMKGMKPVEAAQIAARLPRPLAADILQRMPPADAGRVLGQMKPAEAAEVATELASRQPRAEVHK